MSQRRYVSKNRSIKFVKKLIISIIVSVVGLTPLAIFGPQIAQAAADTCTWTGASSDSISDTGNWTGCDNSHTPEATDTVVFPQSASNKTINVDSSPTYKYIQVTGSGYDFERISFDELTVDGSTSGVTASHDVRFNVPVNLGVTGTDVVNWADNFATVTFNAGGSFGANGTVNFGATGHYGSFIINSSFDGSADKVVALSGTGLTMQTGNTFVANKVGTEGGSFSCLNTTCFGDDSNTIYVDGGSVGIQSNGTYHNNIETGSGAASQSSLTLLSDATFDGSSITINDSLELGLAENIAVTASSAVSIAEDSTLNVIGYNDNLGNSLTLSGQISGDGGLSVDNAHLSLSHSNTYTGPTEVMNNYGGGLLSVTNNDALGTTDGGTVVDSGATVDFANSASQDISENFTINGHGVGGNYIGALADDTKYVVLRGSITLAGDAGVANNAGELMVLTGKISGSGDLTFTSATGGNGIAIANTLANDYTGTTHVVDTRLFMSGTDGVTVIPGDVTVDATNDTAELIHNQSNQIADDSVITLNSGTGHASYSFWGGYSETIGSIAGNANSLIQLGSPSAQLTIGGGDKSGNYSGGIDAYDGTTITKIGTGTWLFNGTDYDGSTGYTDFEITGGVLSVNGSDDSLSNSSFSVNGGTIKGTGVLGAVTATSGMVSPGNSPGCLNPAGNVSFASNSHFVVQLNGNTACTQYDRLAASGIVTLNSPTLDTSLGYTPSIGTVFTILTGSSINGTFSGLPNGATFTLNGRTLRINYTAITVTLTDVSAVSATAAIEASSGTLGKTGDIIKVTLPLLALVGSLIGIVLTKRRNSYRFYAK